MAVEGIGNSIILSNSFDPVESIGEGWKIVEQDKNSLVLAEIDLAEIEFVTTLQNDEEAIGGEGNLSRLKKYGRIRLDARILQASWENQELIPEDWKEPDFICFDGTVLRGPGDPLVRCNRLVRCVLVLYWLGGKWNKSRYWLESDRGIHNPSAVL